MKRYNIQTHKELKSLSFTARPVVYTRHAKERAEQKGVTLYKSLHISAGDVVEMELSFGRLTKLVIRQPLNDSVDRVLVLIPDRDIWRCITVWTNRKDDNHSTLRLSRITA